MESERIGSHTTSSSSSSNDNNNTNNKGGARMSNPSHCVNKLHQYFVFSFP